MLNAQATVKVIENQGKHVLENTMGYHLVISCRYFIIILPVSCTVLVR